MIETRVHKKKTKLPTPWTSNISKRYKRNTIKAELYRANRGYRQIKSFSKRCNGLYYSVNNLTPCVFKF